MMEQTRILRLPEVMHVTGLSRSTIYVQMNNGDFPRSIRLGARSVGWLSTDIEAWVNSRVSTLPSE